MKLKSLTHTSSRSETSKLSLVVLDKKCENNYQSDKKISAQVNRRISRDLQMQIQKKDNTITMPKLWRYE